MYFSLRRILLMVLVCHLFPPAPVRIQNMMISFTDYRNDYLKRFDLEV